MKSVSRADRIRADKALRDAKTEAEAEVAKLRERIADLEWDIHTLREENDSLLQDRKAYTELVQALGLTVVNHSHRLRSNQ